MTPTKVRLTRTIRNSQGRFEIGLVGVADQLGDDGSVRVRVRRLTLRVSSQDLDALDPVSGSWVPFRLMPEPPPSPAPAPTPVAPAPPPVPRPSVPRVARTPTPSAGRSPRSARAIFVGLIVAGIAATGFGFTYTPSAPTGVGYDIDCPQVGHRVNVGPSDPYGLDRDGDGVGCETQGSQFAWLGMIGLAATALGGFGLYHERGR